MTNKNMNSNELRQKYLDFFKSKNHVIIPSESLIPENDPTTLFIGSGMQPLIPYLMGEKHPAGTRLANSQKSFRTEDIEEVGDNRHNTFFEMLGNWSLGDYFKQEQIPWIFEFLTKEINLDPQRLYVTVYKGNAEIGIEKDIESVNLWKTLFSSVGIEAKDIDNAETEGMQNGRIFYYGDKKNWWSRSGIPANMPVGEIGGPDSEMFYDLGADLMRHENSQWKNEPCHVNCDCGRFVEIGNNVFIQFKKTATGFELLPQKNVDFGGGFERLVMASQGTDNIFETDLFINILNKISELSNGKKYRENMPAFEVIADHLKAATFLMGDNKNIAPSNTDQGYIIRRLIRRAIRKGVQLGITKPMWTKEISEVIINNYKNIYSELEKNSEFIVKEMSQEEKKFMETLKRGEKELVKWIDNTKNIIHKLGVELEYANKTQDKKQLNTFFKKNPILPGDIAFKLFATYGFPIELTKEIAHENGLGIDIDVFNKEFKKHQELSQTASAGKFKGGLADASEDTARLHTATHLLNAALRKVLGDHVFQKGSNITGERLRFDFTHGDKMTDEEKTEVENIVNEAIKKDLPISFQEMTVEEAKEKGAIGVFDSKYGDKVKVYKVGDDSHTASLEICGGPHANRTSELGYLRILKEESSSSGVRRIKAILE